MGTNFNWFPLNFSTLRLWRVEKAFGSKVEMRFSLKSTSSSRGYGARSPACTQRSRFLLRSRSRVSVGMPSGMLVSRRRWHDTDLSWAEHSHRGGQAWLFPGSVKVIMVTSEVARTHRHSFGHGTKARSPWPGEPVMALVLWLLACYRQGECARHLQDETKGKTGVTEKKWREK